MGNIDYLNEFFIDEVIAYFVGTKNTDLKNSCSKFLNTLKDETIFIQPSYIQEVNEVSINVSFGKVCDVNILKIKDFCDAKLVIRLVFKVDEKGCLHFEDKSKKIFIRGKKILAIHNKEVTFSSTRDLRDIVVFDYILNGKEKLDFDLKNDEAFKRRTYSRMFAESISCILILANYNTDTCGKLGEKLKNRVTLFKFLIDKENLKIPYEGDE